jgi:DNA polymerase/3'-5' exonuclease PolX
MSNKKGIITNFQILVKYYTQINDRFRVQAYTNAIRAIHNVDKPDITSVKDVTNISGIGKQTLSKISEYLDTGRINKAEEVKSYIIDVVSSDHANVIRLLSSVMDIGPKTAEKLYKAGIRTLDDLRANPQILTRSQLIGLKYYYDLHTRIPRDYVYIFSLMCRYIFTATFGKNSYMMEVAGSYRRGAETSGDIDFLITSEQINLKQIVEVLTKKGVIVENISGANSKEKFMGIVHCPGGGMFHFHLDIVFLPKDEWGSGLLYFTGSKAFNITMRAKAKRLGYQLDQHGLWNNGKKLSINTEEEIMKVLNIPYVLPTKRN